MANQSDNSYTGTDYLAVGTDPATTGSVRLSHPADIKVKNAAGTGTIQFFYVGTNDRLVLNPGSSAQPIVEVGNRQMDNKSVSIKALSSDDDLTIQSTAGSPRVTFGIYGSVRGGSNGVDIYAGSTLTATFGTSGATITNLREGLSAHGNTGSTETIDLANGTVHTATLNANCTLTFSGSAASVACSFTLILTQDGTGSRTVTWPAAVKWPGGTAPTLSTAVGAVDVVVFTTVDNGTTWYGNLAGKAYA